MPKEVTIKHARLEPASVATKCDVLREIARMAAEDAGRSEGELLAALSAREEVGSTGFGGGIAIPHCHLPELRRFVVGVVSVPGGVEFDADDGEPVRLLVFIIAPAERRNEHVALLSSVSRVLTQASVVEELVACPDDDELLRCFCKRWHRPERESASDQKSLLQIFVQREDLLADIIEALSEAVPGHISVIEGRNARSYLHHLPLFSGFWTDTEEGAVQIVTAVVAAALCNDVTRRIMMLSADEGASGVLVVAQDLRFAVGRLDL